MQEPNKPPPQPTAKSGFDDFVRKLATIMLHEAPVLQQRIKQLDELYRPSNVQEVFYLNQLAAAQLEIERIGRLQSGLFSVFMQEGIDGGYGYTEDFHKILQPDTDLNDEQRLNFSLATGFVIVAQKRDVLAFFNRMNTQAERRLRHAQEQFDSIRRQALSQPVATPQAVIPEISPSSSAALVSLKQPSRTNQSPQLVPAKKPPSVSKGPAPSPGKRSRPG